MKTSIKILIGVVATAAIGTTVYFLSKSKGSGLLAYVPNDAVMVARIGLPEISKVFSENEKEIKKMTLWKRMVDSTSNTPMMRAVQGILKKPAESGIDFTQDCMFFVHKSQRGYNNGLLFRIRSYSDFSNYIVNNAPAGTPTGEEAGIKFAEYGIGVFITWKDDVAMIIDQKAETKGYFADILNKKNPGAKGNLLLSQAESSTGLMDIVLRVDDFFKGKDGLIASEGIQNPFPAGTAIVGAVKIENGDITTEFRLESTNNDGLKNLGILKTSGMLEKYQHALFSNGKPYGAYAVSMNIAKAKQFLIKMVPEIEEKFKEPEIKEMMDAFTGDLVVGITSPDKPYDYEYEEGVTEEEVQKHKGGIIAHIGIKNMDLLRKKLAEYAKLEDGIYETTNYPALYALEYDQHFIVSLSRTSLQEIQKSKGKTSASGKLTIPAECLKAPFAMVSDTSTRGNFLGNFLLPFGGSRAFKFMDSLNYKSYVYAQDGLLKSRAVFMGKKSVHPVLAVVRAANAVLEASLAEEKRREEIYRKMREELNLNLQEGI